MKSYDEAMRLAATGKYKQAAKMFAWLGYPEQARHYEAQSKIKKS